MMHQMKLWHAPFLRLREGTKTIELRLYDEKRSGIAAGDTILFADSDSGETLTCLVLALHRYPSFEALYAHHEPVSLGYAADEPASPADMLAYYSAENIRKYGVVGIEIRVI